MKTIRDGKVAVSISPGFGAGWSTWNGKEYELFTFPDEKLVSLIEYKCESITQNQLLERSRDIEQYVCEVLGANSDGDIGESEYVYLGGSSDLIVEWVPVGTKFRISEYDGSETLELCDDIIWSVA